MAENQTTQTQVPSEHKFPPFERDTFASQIVWFVVTFILLYLLVSKIGLPRIDSIMAARRNRIEGDLSEANQLKVKADQAFAAYETELAEARSRAQTLAQETRDRLAREADRDRHALEERLNAKLAEAEKAIESTRAAAMANVHGIAVEAAIAIVDRLTGTAPSAKLAAGAVDEVLKG